MPTETKQACRTPQEKECVLMIKNGYSKKYVDSVDEEEGAHPVNVWKLLTFLFIIISVILFTVLVSMCALSRDEKRDKTINETSHDNIASRRSADADDVNAGTRKTTRGSEIFAELSRTEIDSVVDFLHRQEGLNLVGPKQAMVNSNFIHSIEMKLPGKKKVLHYLEDGGNMPKRMATVYIFIGGEAPPVVDEYVVGDLPNVTYGHRVITSRRKTRIPFTNRPFSTAEFRAIFGYIIPNVTHLARHVFQESYGATPLDCGDRCLRFSMAPIASTFIKEGTRKAWFWFQYDMEFPSVRPLDLQLLVDMTDVEPSKWEFENVWYCDQMFDNFTIFLHKYNSDQINKTRVSFPTGKSAKYGTMEFRHPLFPDEQKRAPRQIEPDGPRFTIIENEIHYTKWKMNFRVSASGGLQLLNIRFGDERIIYELSMQEVAVLYSGNNPVSRIMNYADGAGMYGTRYRGLMPGSDCPGHAQFVDTYIYSSNEFGSRIFENAFCVFELNTHSILRRHRAYGRTGAYYGGLEAIILVIRSIISIVNYDYVFDFMFYQNGVIETKVSMTGYLGTSFYSPAERIYSAHVHEHVSAGLHNHLFHFKVDIDAKGTRNRYETLDIKIRNETDLWNPSGYHIQPVFETNLKRTEKAAVAGYDINTPKYHIISQHNDVTNLGNTRGIRLVLNKLSKQLLPEGYGFEPAISWSRHQLAITRYHEEEERSSSLFTMWDAADPVVNFQKYLDDDESVVDEDLVAWISLGVQHLPQTENLPLTCAIGTQLSFHIIPYNYFDEDPSMHSRDAVRVTPLDKSKPLAGAHVEHYGALNSSGCMPHTYPVERLKHNSTFLFS